MVATHVQRQSSSSGQSGHDDPAYWAARVLIAIRDNKTESEQLARQELRRLGFELVSSKRSKNHRDSR